MKSEIESPLPVVPTPSTLQQPTSPTSPPTAAPHVISAPSNSAVSFIDSGTLLSITGSEAECVPQRSSKKRGIEHLEEGGVNGGVARFGEGVGEEIEVRRTKRLKVSAMETADVISTNNDTNTNRNISVDTDFLRDLVASDTELGHDPQRKAMRIKMKIWGFGQACATESVAAMYLTSRTE
jgi:hypothetical protein